MASTDETLGMMLNVLQCPGQLGLNAVMLKLRNLS